MLVLINIDFDSGTVSPATALLTIHTALRIRAYDDGNERLVL